VVAGHQTTEDWIAATSGAWMPPASSSRLVDRSWPWAASSARPFSDAGQFQELVVEGGSDMCCSSSVRDSAGFLGGSDSRTRDDWVRAACVAITDPSIGGNEVSGRRCTTVHRDAPAPIGAPLTRDEHHGEQRGRDAGADLQPDGGVEVTSWRGARDGRPDGVAKEVEGHRDRNARPSICGSVRRWRIVNSPMSIGPSGRH